MARNWLNCQVGKAWRRVILDSLLCIKVFARVAERGGFSAAGRDLGISQSAVSKAVTALEDRLGVRLVNRSTRSVALTEAGRVYYRHCRNMLAELEEADAAVAAAQSEIGGALAIAAPVPFGLMFVSPAVARFQSLSPGLAISLELNDRHVDLVEENIDVAIRLGRVGGGELAARKLGDSPFLTVATPGYLARYGTPVVPESLREHKCLVYSPEPGHVQWDFAAPAGVMTVGVAAAYRCNNLLVLKDAAVAGLGIARLPQWMVASELASGALCAVMADYPPPPYAIHAVFPSPRGIAAKARRFADFMQDELAGFACFTGVRQAFPRQD